MQRESCNAQDFLRMRGDLMNTTFVKRGDIVLCNFKAYGGSVQRGYRPAVILQNDKYNASSPTTIVAPITSSKKRTELFAHIVLGKRFGLLKPSMILLEQVQTVNQDELGKCVGHIDDEEVINRIDRGLRKVLDMKNRLNPSSAYDERDVMCLCSVCRNVYSNRGFSVIRIGGDSGQCDLCNYRPGIDYAVVGLLSR